MDEIVWKQYKFPTRDIDFNRSWVGKHKQLSKPYCWTPTDRFRFGGKEFIPLYPCIAFETKNFGYVCQKLWDTVVVGRE